MNTPDDHLECETMEYKIVTRIAGGALHLGLFCHRGTGSYDKLMAGPLPAGLLDKA
jgi:hypothetical protein